MKLNHDCVRDVLLFIEENYQIGKFLSLDEFINSNSLSKYDSDEIKYVILKLADAQYIQGKPTYGSNVLSDFYCSGLTWNGHLFLDNIRDSKVWRETKEKVSILKSVSVTMLSSIGSQIVAKMLGL